MPVIADETGGGAKSLRRRYPRGLSRWQFEIPGTQEMLDPIRGLAEYLQGDTPIWFDGAGFADITAPILLMIGDGTTTDVLLPHRYWMVASTVVYINGAPTNQWAPQGGNGVFMDSFRFTTAPVLNAQVTAIGRRKVKCVISTDEKPELARLFRSGDATRSIHHLRLTLAEVAT